MFMRLPCLEHVSCQGRNKWIVKDSKLLDGRIDAGKMACQESCNKWIQMIMGQFNLVGTFNIFQPLWKMMEFASWDDDIPNIWKNWKVTKNSMVPVTFPVTTNQQQIATVFNTEFPSETGWSPWLSRARVSPGDAPLWPATGDQNPPPGATRNTYTLRSTNSLRTGKSPSFL